MGTAAELLETILEGTGWEPGYVENFVEKRGGATKIRSLKAPAKTGAFKLIQNMCDLFEAKPIYHGDSKTVDIVSMNPFSEPEDGKLPKITDNKAIELHYGKNVKNVSRILNTENIVTKLYCYGAYGDKTSGYCGIDEWKHPEYTLTYNQDIPAGTECEFVIKDQIAGINYTRYFTAKTNIPAGTELIWSLLDPASMSYVWDGTNAHKVYEDRKTDDYVPLTVSAVTDVVNRFSFLMDFDYYNNVGLLTDGMVQTIAEYQRTAPGIMETANIAATEFANTLNDLSNVIGSVDFVKLDVSDYASDNGYLKLLLRKTEQYPKGVIYRTDYTVRENKQFKWRIAEKLKANGDPLSGAPSIVYIIHTDTTPYSYDAAYLKTLYDDNGQKTDADGDIGQISLWMQNVGYKAKDEIYLFKANTINALLGSLQSSDEKTVETLDSTTKVITTKHPVKFSETAPALNDFDDYAWWWKYTADDYENDEFTPSVLYYCNKNAGDTTWQQVVFTDTEPSAAGYKYYYNWKQAVLYQSENNQWIALNESSEQQRFGALFGTIYLKGQTRDKNYKGYYQYYTIIVNQDLIDKYGSNNKLPVGNYAIEDEYGTYYMFSTNKELGVGSYIVYDTTNHWVVIDAEDPRSMSASDVIDRTVEAKSARFDNVFENSSNVLKDALWEEGGLSPQEALKPDSKIIYEGGGEIDGTGVYRSSFCNAYPNIQYELSDTSLTVFMYTIENSFLGCAYLNGNSFTTVPNTRHLRFLKTVNQAPTNIVCAAKHNETSFIMDEEAYYILGSLRETYSGLQDVIKSGTLKGIIPLIKQFKILSDQAYITKKNILDQAQKDVKRIENDLVDSLGDIYREGYWQKNDYVDGDEDKLYNDGLENLRKIAMPDAKYTIQYLDLYGANAENFEYASNDISADTYWPDIDADYGVHLVDPEIGISQWAFIDKIQKCYDQWWKTQISINTNMSTIAQHSFTDVLTNIANVAQNISGKMNVYDRAMVFDEYSNISTSSLEGEIDAAKLKITGGSSTWYTDDKGNMVFESADGKSAMMISGNGFMLAASKDQYGDWVWRTAGTGEGLVADVITAGTLNADRVITPLLISRLNE